MSINQLTGEQFRQKLAGLIDPNRQIPKMEQEVIKDETIKFVSNLAELFGDSLDRMTLWERIGNGIVVCCAKCGGDWEVFVNQILLYIKADPGKVAANKELEYFYDMMQHRPREWKDAFLQYLETRHMLVIIKARALWNEKKKGRKIEKEEATE